MQILWMLVPLVLFYVSFKLYDIFVATGILMATSTLSLLIQWLKNRHLAKQDLVAWVFILVFGALTLFFHNDLFVKWKPTILFCVMTLIIIGNRALKRSPISELLLGERVALTTQQWGFVDLSFALFYGLLGFINYLVFTWMSNEAWALFKAFGILGATLIFTVFIGFYIAKHTPQIDNGHE